MSNIKGNKKCTFIFKFVTFYYLKRIFDHENCLQGIYTYITSITYILCIYIYIFMKHEHTLA